jgi:hypothetical protein
MVSAHPDSPASKAMREIASRLAESVAGAAGGGIRIKMES